MCNTGILQDFHLVMSGMWVEKVRGNVSRVKNGIFLPVGNSLGGQGKCRKSLKS